MTKQLVNLIGAAAAVGILLLGIVVGALPVLSAAQTTASSADDVALQNQTQETLLDALRAQAADMTELEDDVAALRAAIPTAAHLDDVLLLALDAARDHGGTVTSLTPATPEPFAIRTGETGEPAAPPAAEEPAAEAPAEEASAAPPAADVPAAVPEEAAPAQVAVTIVIEAADVDAATRMLDALRAGPRVVAVTQAGVAEGAEGGVTLTATVLAFSSP